MAKEIESAQRAGQNERVEVLKETVKNLEAAIKAYQDETLGTGYGYFQDGKQVQIPTPGKQWLTEGISSSL
ncbi:hypothetical protein GJ744_007551 [Endocarpon pusillum]|uniref:Uncharacterized protein n=1 Tax=Endocarpon pusillum TaxID=364733 RepID=A0A8H7E5Y7_9EURO|nr:hypothetical protein GJ744_007551 [Endocarpon pusillum]